MTSHGRVPQIYNFKNKVVFSYRLTSCTKWNENFYLYKLTKLRMVAISHVN